MNQTALATTHTENLMFMPVMDMEVAVMRRNNVVEFVKRIMVDGVDYGKIPGAGDKPTLLKPGAEKLSTFFGLTPMFIPISVVEDWTGDEHKGEAFFYYRYRCELHRTGNLVASSEGSCNTWESKYRYRKGERVCPSCGKPAIKKSKYPPKGRPSDLPGWYCFSKADGCGAEFDANDKRIIDQEVGRILNPDVADQVNTVQKMAQKRSLIAATLLAVNASEFFTQDIEDMVIDGEWTPVVEPAAKSQGKAKQTSANDDVPFENPFHDAPPQEPERILASQSQRNRMHALGMEYYKTAENWDKKRPQWVRDASGGAVESSNDLSPEQMDWIITLLEQRIAKRAALNALDVITTVA